MLNGVQLIQHLRLAHVAFRISGISRISNHVEADYALIQHGPCPWERPEIVSLLSPTAFQLLRIAAKSKHVILLTAEYMGFMLG